MSALSAEGDLAQVRWISEQYPPYNYTDPDGEARGIAVDVLAEVWRRLEVGLTRGAIEFLPWARGYALLQREPNTALFSTTYTPERQRLFRFVGPYIDTRVVLVAPRRAHLKLTRDEELDSLRIGVVREDIGAQLLRTRGVGSQNLVFSNSSRNLVRLLEYGRVDAIAYSYDVAVWSMLNGGMDPTDYQIVYSLLEGDLGFAFHSETDPRMLEHMQEVLQALIKEGVVEQIRLRYLGR
ncbi:transporter substrate-binding domain-containing protein [Motiliproteus sp. SC1-56]|uniref:substrate-binding periplasmic protein n=1 Tax=Motiliproteus sp. SC1-56 TaxID=2799565 RepID=UPI001A9028C2